MYKTIVVAFDESKQAGHALTAAIELARLTGAELRLVTVSEPLPAFTAFVDYAMPGVHGQLLEQRRLYYSELQQTALKQAATAGLTVQAVVIEGDEVSAIVDYIVESRADLLVIGRRHHSSVHGLGGGTVHEIGERARCSILGVY
jgi:nucleotide-binding universal stress UspA family protein